MRLSPLRLSDACVTQVSQGHHGREALRGEFEATSAICSITPDFCPKSIAWSTLANSPDSHFYLCRFYDFAGGIPEPIGFCEKLARLHQAQVSPSGKFGFHCTTYNGDLPQDNTWSNNWETFFANGLRHVLRVREERAGPNSELDELLPALFENVIPRLLRPMESNGRKLQPSLVHSDLWYGNAAITDSETNEGIVFDPAHFWAHNECELRSLPFRSFSGLHATLQNHEPADGPCMIDELGNWRPKRNKFSDSYFDAYHKIMPKTEPVEDYDDRNALYALYGVESFQDYNELTILI
jgi:fructosamine-3-kinase